MIKKTAAFVLVFVMAAAMWMIPAHASVLTDALFFEADYNTGSLDSTVGSIHGVEYNPPDESNVPKVEFTTDSDIGRKVLSFQGESAIFYDDFDYVKFQNNFTFEVYVKLPARDAVAGWGYIAGTYWNTNPDCGVGFTYGMHSISNVGANRKFNVLQGDGTQSYTTFKGSKADGNWMHLVYTHDGVTEAYYENGVLVESLAATQEGIPSAANDDLRGFRVGAYNKVAQFATKMDCAYVRVYAVAATADEVAEMYANRNSDVDKSNNTVNNDPNPATAAPAPTATKDNSGNSQQGNTPTFDLGVVSLAAVALSSAVAMKKRKH